MTINEIFAQMGVPQFAWPLIRRMMVNYVPNLDGHFDDPVQVRFDTAAGEVSLYLANVRVIRLSFAELEGMFNAGEVGSCPEGGSRALPEPAGLPG